MPRNLVNLLLGAAVGLALISGTLAFGTGTPVLGWALAVTHGVAGLVLLVLAVAKSRVVRRGWSAGRPSRWTGAVLVTTAVGTVLTGIAQALGFRSFGPVTAIQLHVPLAIGTGVLVVWHVIVHPVPAWRTITSRRAALRSLGVMGMAGVAWATVEGVALLRGPPGGRRRFTGSARVPRPLVTQWFTDSVQRIDVDGWQLAIVDSGGAHHLSLADLTGRSAATQTVDAVLDCTGGWYVQTRWAGVPLTALVHPAPEDRSVVVTSSTGYRRRFPLEDLEHLLLATTLDDRPLTAGHGAPARLVAPGRRGFWWVKWVAEIRTDPALWATQPPFPLR